MLQLSSDKLIIRKSDDTLIKKVHGEFLGGTKEECFCAKDIEGSLIDNNKLALYATQEYFYLDYIGTMDTLTPTFSISSGIKDSSTSPTNGETNYTVSGVSFTRNTIKDTPDQLDILMYMGSTEKGAKNSRIIKIFIHYDWVSNTFHHIDSDSSTKIKPFMYSTVIPKGTTADIIFSYVPRDDSESIIVGTSLLGFFYNKYNSVSFVKTQTYKFIEADWKIL